MPGDDLHLLAEKADLAVPAVGQEQDEEAVAVELWRVHRLPPTRTAIDAQRKRAVVVLECHDRYGWVLARGLHAPPSRPIPHHLPSLHHQRWPPPRERRPQVR